MTTSPYILPTASSPLTGSVVVPGSKSIMNRALILSALAHDSSMIISGLSSRDSQLMLLALTQLGCRFEGDLAHTLICHPPHNFTAGHVDVGLSGTVLRFIVALAGLAHGHVTFYGDAAMSHRPISPILHALTHMGVNITGTHLPFSVMGTGTIAGGTVNIDASASSQFISGLLLSASRYTQETTLIHQGHVPPSQPHIDMTIAMLETLGAHITTHHNPHRHTFQWSITPRNLPGHTWVIEPDLSNACVFFAAALATQGTISIPGWAYHQWQPKHLVRQVFESMGARWEETPSSEEKYTITVSGENLHGIEADLHDISELTPTIAALATLATTPTIIRGVSHIRGHETDRLQALSTEINAIGGNCIETDDGLIITPQPLTGGIWHSYADHRMATAAAICALRYQNISVDDITTTSKTMPQFPQLWHGLFSSHIH